MPRDVLDKRRIARIYLEERKKGRSKINYGIRIPGVLNKISC